MYFMMRRGVPSLQLAKAMAQSNYMLNSGVLGNATQRRLIHSVARSGV